VQNKDNFTALMENFTLKLRDKKLDDSLTDELNLNYSFETETFKNIQMSCEKGIEEGWLCQNEHGGIKYGRVLNDINGYSVDVVVMTDIVGPHHAHPKGEIDLIMPIEGNAKFDKHAAGWVVYGPGSSHRPTVTDGTAIVLYLLPDGEIDFSRP
jgi:hypothetical protein